MKYVIEKEPLLRCHIVYEIQGSAWFPVFKGLKKECKEWLKTIL